MRFKLLPLALSAVAAVAMQSAHAEYPNRPVTIVVPFAAGGPTDKVARDLGEALRKQLGVTVVIDNSGGAGGAIGAAKVARATPDGYTLLLNHIGMATIPSLMRNLPFKVESDFEYLGLINDVPMTLIAKPSLPAKDFPELEKVIRESKNAVTIGNAGIGSASHLCGLLFQSALKAQMTPVPYKGTAPAITDLIGGQIDIMCDQTTNTTSQIESGKVKVFGVTSAKRLSIPALKSVPTLDEAGLKNFRVSIWHGLYAPKGTPAAALKRMNDALRAALKDPEFISREEALGAVVVTDNRVEPEGHKKFVQAEIAKWTPVIKAAGVYAD